MTTRLRDVNLRALNSATKYPSIPTYHRIGDKGRLQEDVLVPFPLDPSTEYEITEKIDGTNARILVNMAERDEYIIGSREELLTHSSDVIFNPSQGIVEALRPTVEKIVGRLTSAFVCDVLAFYGEVYGGKINAAKTYTLSGAYGFRLFDIAGFDWKTFEEAPEALAKWRDDGGQLFLGSRTIDSIAFELDVMRVPHLGHVHDVPTTILDTYNWLAKVLAGGTHASIDSEPGGAEGIVIRTVGRNKIAKLRIEDYARTIRR